MTTIYHYSAINGELTGQSEADNDPIDDLPLIPALATTVTPPVAGANEKAVFNANAWDLVDDFRGWIGFDLLGNEQPIRELGIAPDATWNTTIPFILANAQEVKRGDIRTAFNTAELLPVTDTNSTTWSGGFNSALKMDAAKRMAQLAGFTQLSLFDLANVEHVLTVEAAEVVVLTVGADYQTKFAQKQALMVAVDALPNTATQADIDAIVVAF